MGILSKMFKEVITLSVLLLASLALAVDTTVKPTDAPTTVKPTEVPTTVKPTEVPTEPSTKPTDAPTTSKPTDGPTTTPGPATECEQLTLDGCGEELDPPFEQTTVDNIENCQFFCADIYEGVCQFF